MLLAAKVRSGTWTRYRTLQDLPKLRLYSSFGWHSTLDSGVPAFPSLVFPDWMTLEKVTYG